jgi:hypothetical protein
MVAASVNGKVAVGGDNKRFTDRKCNLLDALTNDVLLKIKHASFFQAEKTYYFTARVLALYLYGSSE